MEKLILKVQTKTNHGDFDEFVVFESDKLDLGLNSKKNSNGSTHNGIVKTLMIYVR